MTKRLVSSCLTLCVDCFLLIFDNGSEDCPILTECWCYWISELGTLLRKLENGLRGISHVIVDEIHERDINVRMLCC